MAEYNKHVLGEATKGFTAAIVGAILLWAGQHWLNSDLEFKRVSREGYLSAPLGQQGLTMAFDGKPLKNVSVVEFSIVNRTPKQVANADLVFTVNDNTDTSLVSAGVIPPRGMSVAETIEELPSKDPMAHKFRIKVLPKQRDSEYFNAVFVFDGDKAPLMSISSVAGDVSIVPYQQWKDTITATFFALALLCLGLAAQFVFMSFIEYFLQPRRHKKEVEKFTKHAVELQQQKKLKSTGLDVLADAGTIYASFTRPKPSKFWSKVLPDQRFEY